MATPEDLLAIYKETWANIRETDQISLKLLGFVPAVSASGAGLLAFAFREHPLPAIATELLAASGALITFAIYLWERRNIQTCSWLFNRALDLESQLKLSLLVRPDPPTLLKRQYGKREAENILYTVSVLVWLIPLVAARAAH